MKKLLFILFLFLVQIAFCQAFVVKLDNQPNAQEYPVLSDRITELNTNLTELSTVYVVFKTPTDTNKDFSVKIEGSQSEFSNVQGETQVQITISNFDLNGRKIKITDSQNNKISSKLVLKNFNSVMQPSQDDDDDDDDDDDISNFMTSEEIVNDLFPDAVYKQRVGIIIPKSNPNTRYGGENYVHIFLDGYGNPIIRAVPQGSPEKTYVVHIVTSIPKTNETSIRYNVKQTAGGIDDTLLFRNAGKIDMPELHSAASFFPYHSEIALTESNKNVVFEVFRGVIGEEGYTNTSLGSHTIPIKIYNGSFDVGLISSELENPTYSFVASTDNETMGKIKKADMGKRGIVTTMATFYASPIILLEKFIFKPKDKNGKTIDIPNYKLTGRNFVSDHKIYERIYPTVGLSINEEALENIFYGFNFEAVRGASLFVGWHHGKVNTFTSTDSEFSFNESVIALEDFNLNQNQKWKTDFAIGVNLDILVILNLLQQGGSATK